MAQGVNWTAASRAAFVTPSLTRVSLRWIVRNCLALSFLFAFLQYEVGSGPVQFAHVGLFLVSGVLVLCGRRRTERLQHIFSAGGLLFGAVLFGEFISYTSHDNYSTLYGLLFIVIILSARLIVLEIGIPNVVRAYSQAGILTVILICISGREALLSGNPAAGRFNGGTRAHPNLVSFFLGGFLPVIVWRALEEKVRWRKRALVVLAFATFLFIFLSGSRGTLSATLVAGLALLIRGAAAAGWIRRFRLRHYHIIIALILLPMAAVLLTRHNHIAHIADYLNDSLQLSSSQRGVHSGLSGRTGIWTIAFNILRAQDRWFFGFGYRAGDRLVGTIDNGYVQLLFESGLIAGSMILGSMVRVFVLLWQASRLQENNAWTRYYTALWCLMIVYFLNNISTRYLFSFGSSFSLLVILMMAASRRELVGGGMPEPKTQPVTGHPHAAGQLVPNRYRY